MTLQDRDKRALLALAGMAVISLAVYFWPAGGAVPMVAPATASTPMAERRLAKLREVAATIPARQKVLEEATAELAEREKGLLRTETAAQAQALLLQMIRKLARAQSPGIELQQSEIGQVAPLGPHYGEVPITVGFQCRIEQLVNLLADISAQPELVATRELVVRTADQKQKTIAVRLTLSGVIPKALMPDNKGGQGL